MYCYFNSESLLMLLYCFQMQLTLSSPKRVNLCWRLMKHGETGQMRKVRVHVLQQGCE